MNNKSIDNEKATDHSRWRIGVDVGGTFTDLILLEADGSVEVTKVSSIPGNPGRGVLNAVEAAAESRGVSTRELLSGCGVFVHGTTIATNTVLEGKGACVGLLTTRGFRDSLEIRRGQRGDPWHHRNPYPEVIVPRQLRRSVGARINREGQEDIPVDPDEVADAVALFRRTGVESVAVCFFNSFLNSEQEQQAQEHLRNDWKFDWVSLSSEVSPTIGEYERTSTAVVNAYIAPRTVGYLTKLAEKLGEQGLRQQMLLMQNNAGTATVSQLSGRPSTLLLSGPAAAVGALEHYSKAAGTNNLISMEIGGTSCDIAMMADGSVALTDALSIAGYDLALPSVDIHTIGAGGGTIAGVDMGGLFYVGPAGAGAEPGPACYGKGGTLPTATDAQVALGRLAPGAFAGGTIEIDDKAAREAISTHIAQRLDLDVEKAAAGIVQLLEQNLLQGVQQMSSERGHDPRKFTLVACGGAGPIHGASVARKLGMSRVFVPQLAGAFCAVGLLNSDLRQDYVRVHLTDLDNADVRAIEAIWSDLEETARDILLNSGLVDHGYSFERGADLRYRGQQWDVTIPLGPEFDMASIRASFEEEHERLFGHKQPDGAIEVTKLRLSGIGRLDRHEAQERPVATNRATPEIHETRSVWLDEGGGRRNVPVYRGTDLQGGDNLAGPLVVEEATTTILVGTDDRLEVLPTGDYLIHVD